MLDDETWLPDDVSNTVNVFDTGETRATQLIVDGSTGMVRRLTPLEFERLQGFPDGWTAGQSDTARCKQMGNAVTVNVVEYIGRRLG